MVPHNSEFTRKLRAAVRAKIEEFGIDVDDELPDYVMIMVGNKKDKARMKSDLKLFLGDKTSDFVEWLFGFFQKVKNATASSSAPTQQQPQKQSSGEGSTDKEKKRTADKEKVKGDAEGKAAEKVSSMEEKPTKHVRRERTSLPTRGGRESEKASSDRAKPFTSSSADSQLKRNPSHAKKLQPSPPYAHCEAFPSVKNRSRSRNRSPPRNDRGGGTKPTTPPRRTRPSPVPKSHGERSISPSVDRKSVVLPSKGPPALRSVVSVPVQFLPTTHPRVRAVARSPSPPPSSPSPHPLSPLRMSAASPKVMLSGGVVPVETPSTKTPGKIVNQLDIAAVAPIKNGGRRPREEQQPAREEFIPRKQQVIRTALSPPSRNGGLSANKPAIEATTAKVPRRRVIFGGGSLIFQRAIQQQQQTATTTANSANAAQKTPPKATVMVRPQVRMVTVSSPPLAETEEDKAQTTTIESATTKRRTLAIVSQQQQTGASLFQRAIKETKRQRTEGEDTADGMGKRPRRIIAEIEQTNIKPSEAEDTDEGDRKRLRIDTEQPKKQTEEEKEERQEAKKEDEGVEKEEQNTDREKQQQRKEGERGQKEKGEEEEQQREGVLTIDMSRKTGPKREIKRPPKFGLELVKEHIGKESRAEDEERGKGQEHVEERQTSPLPLTNHRKEKAENIQRREAEAKQRAEDSHAEREGGGKETPERTVHFKRIWTSHASALTTSAPIWDGRIEIDDMSSTDDEAEIDAVLADAQRLRQLALERELPPTAAMSRPLLYDPLDFCLPPETGMISPSEAALLPAVTYKQLVMLSSGGNAQEKQQQLNTANGNASVASANVGGDGVVTTVSATCASTVVSDPAQQIPQQRPHATVAPTTTIQAAPATMIVQQQYQYHHQNPQLRPRSHPYAQGYVPPSLGGHAYRYQVNRGSVSKVYTGGSKMQFAIQNVTAGEKDSLKQRLHLLRERHRQKSQSLQRHLEEQRLLLGQLQKMAPTAETEQRKELLSRVRQMDAPIGQLKRELNEVSEQITKVTKCDG